MVINKPAKSGVAARLQTRPAGDRRDEAVDVGSGRNDVGTSGVSGLDPLSQLATEPLTRLGGSDGRRSQG